METGKLLLDLLDKGTWQTLGDLPPEATFATTTYCQDYVERMPDEAESIKVFQMVPARWTELPIEMVKQRVMLSPEFKDDFADFQAYHAWYMKGGDVPLYGSENRWPCMPSGLDDEAFEDGWHRFHAYVEAGHTTIPVMEYDEDAWWKAHADWLDESRPRLLSRGPR